jgi:hypothetical protein
MKPGLARRNLHTVGMAVAAVEATKVVAVVAVGAINRRGYVEGLTLLPHDVGNLVREMFRSYDWCFPSL